MKKPKVIVTLNEYGTVKVHTDDVSAVDVMVLEYGISEEPEIYIHADACGISAEDFNDVLNDAIMTFESAIKRCKGDQEMEEDVKSWKEDIKMLKGFQLK